MRSEVGFRIRTARRGAATPDTDGGEGVWDAAEYPSVCVRCRVCVPTRFRRDVETPHPGQGAAVSSRARVGVGYQIWSEFGAN